MTIRVVLQTQGVDRAGIRLIKDALRGGDVLLVERERADVLVIALASADLVQERREVPTVAVVEDAGRERIRELVMAGAAAVLPLQHVQKALYAAVVAAGSGLVALPRESIDLAVAGELSLREKQVLALVTMGLTNAEIAGRLYLTESTVKYHLLSIYRKLGVRTRRQAAELATDPRSGLTPGVVAMTGRTIREPSGYQGPKVD